MKRTLQETANKIYKAINKDTALMPRHSKYNLSRTDYRAMRHTSVKEYNKAKLKWFTDTEILDALYSGTGAQMMYAKFLEHEIVGKVL